MYSTLFVVVFSLVAASYADWRIINGNDASMHEFPSIVSIKYNTDHFCGGTLIDKRTVLTAAHCVYDARFDSEEENFRLRLVAVLGEHQLDKPTGKERVIPVAKVIIHPGFNSERAFVRGNDIALLRLARDVVEEDHVRIANFPAQGEEPSEVGQTCTLVGWGSLTKNGYDSSNILQKAGLKIITNDACAAKFRNTRNNPSNVCAGSGVGSTSACRGDSGGPIFCKQRDGSLIQVGAVSYGKRTCGLPNVPTVFTRISNFGDWIRSQL